jgi:hypothetical protein
MRRWKIFPFFSQSFNVSFTNYAALVRFCFVLHPAGTSYSIEKQQKTASLAAFDGPCLGACRLITGTVAVSTGLSFFSQNQKNRSITIKTLEHENGRATQKQSQSEKDHSLDEKTHEEKKQEFAGEWVGRTYYPDFIKGGICFQKWKKRLPLD